jgi:diguanylate cyclase (GGDEF)-like protein
LVPSSLAAGAALIIVGVLALLYLYRRRQYILYWIGAWALVAGSMFVAARSYGHPQLDWLAYGTSQFLSICGAVAFVAAADAYSGRSWIRRSHVPVLLPLAIWFVLAPVALGTAAVFVPGHALTAAALLAASAGHFLILRDTRLLGAGMVGLLLGITALKNVAVAFGSVATMGQLLPEGFLWQLTLYLVTAFGMQLMTFEDMTLELKRANGRLEHARSELRQMVITDALTGCRNRRFFDEVIDHEISAHRRYGTPLSLMFVDVDRFKTINDTLGHHAGDRVLREVASFLIRSTRDSDYVFRWGGDEFLLLLSCREEEGVRRGREMQLEFPRTPEARSLPAGVGLSFGVSEIPVNAESVQDALKRADERMYVNKRADRMAVEAREARAM